jgi:CBS domain-containing protein
VADDPRPALTLRDLMTTRVVAVGPDDPVADAAAAMIGRKVGSALIMQGRFLAGILTERDVLRAVASGSDLTSSPVSAWMTRDPEPASPDTTVEDATQLMLLHGFRHLPVLDGRSAGRGQPARPGRRPDPPPRPAALTLVGRAIRTARRARIAAESHAMGAGAGRLTGDAVKSRHGMLDRGRGQYGYRHSEVVQRRQGVWLHRPR